jgi:hypothetical protein
MNVKRTQTIFINSANRLSGDINDFNVHLHDQLVKAVDNKTQIRISVIHLCMNRSYYTVRNNTNFMINNLTTGQSTEFGIRTGYYNVNTFSAYLLTLLINWKIDYDASRNIYTFTPPNDQNTYSFQFFDSGHLFGMDEDIISDSFSYDNPLTSTKPILMNLDNSLYIRTSIARKPGGAVDNLTSPDFIESDILCCLPMTFSPFNNINIDCSNNFVFYLNVQELTTFRLFVTDQSNNLIDLKYDYTVGLKIEYCNLEDDDETLKTLQEIRDLLKYSVLHFTSSKK